MIIKRDEARVKRIEEKKGLIQSDGNLV